MDQKRTKSTRMWLLVIGIAFAVLKEVLGYFDIQVTTETLLTIEGMIITTAGLDTIRPLGKGKGSPAPEEAEKAADESSES